jgi:hypothetical protein
MRFLKLKIFHYFIFHKWKVVGQMDERHETNGYRGSSWGF